MATSNSSRFCIFGLAIQLMLLRFPIMEASTLHHEQNGNEIHDHSKNSEINSLEEEQSLSPYEIREHQIPFGFANQIFHPHSITNFLDGHPSTSEVLLKNTHEILSFRNRKAFGGISRLYHGGPGGHRTKMLDQRYSIRSGSRLPHYTLPSTTSLEYLDTEFRRLFSTSAPPRRPYAMRLRWG